MTLEEIKRNVDCHTSHLKLKLDEVITKQDMLHAAVEQWSKQGYSVVSSIPTSTTSISRPPVHSPLPCCISQSTPARVCPVVTAPRHPQLPSVNTLDVFASIFSLGIVTADNCKSTTGSAIWSMVHPFFSSSMQESLIRLEKRIVKVRVLVCHPTHELTLGSCLHVTEQHYKVTTHPFQWDPLTYSRGPLPPHQQHCETEDIPLCWERHTETGAQLHLLPSGMCKLFHIWAENIRSTCKENTTL